ncbi:hypothetical protein BY996DRAFT_6408871 [Phakopsora pachyrhizi]|nr:hypothetical protein BY996DRAFT_6408871 [Phakopsora pachyrhizi]
MRRKQIFESFLINKLPKIYPIVSVFSKKHQNKVLEEILVPEIGALMEEFALDVPPFEILNQVGHRDFFEKLEGDCFFRHKLIYHSIKLAFRYEPEKFDKRMIRQTLVFEETLKMVISKMEMIQLMAYSGLEYNPTWRGPVMDMIKNINRKLHRGKYARESLDMSSFKKSVTKKFQDREILKIWPAWRDELIRAKNSVEEQNKKYNDFIDSIEPGGDQYEIENTWKNSRLIAGIRGEFQASVRPEIKVLELMEAMDNWMIEIKNRPETKKSLRDRVISYFTSS